ncbi:helix-turn-helix domain-containing protein [Sphingomonas sp. PB4P5]|uniref:helix-turn-helix domain-containing protein n=1 Tax=Parasphingomonas puruogangriensis TaxID=3096155 RepID=UPI002FCC96E5
MNMQVNSGAWALTEREKQTLRLIVRGHDAKSVARNLGLSVHTINERLRDARRKMAVSSSREAARLLLEAEDSAAPPTPDLLGDVEIGEDAPRFEGDQEDAPISGVRRAYRAPLIFIGVLLMTFALGLLALAILPPAAAPPATAPTVSQAAPDAAVVDAARQWLVLVDQARWDDSYRGTGTAFQKLNTAEVWAATSDKVRVPLGAVISRTFVSQQDLPAPPAGYQVVKFRTRFANKAEAIETVSLEREAGAWRVVGVTIE